MCLTYEKQRKTPESPESESHRPWKKAERLIKQGLPHGFKEGMPQIFVRQEELDEAGDRAVDVC